MKTRSTILYIMCALLLAVAPHTVWADEPEPVAEVLPKVRIFGNVYGGGELAQVTEPNTDSVTNHIIQDADLADLFTTHADHVYTTYVHLGTGAEVFGRVFGGGKGDEDSFDGEGVRTENPAGKVIGQTDVALDGATVWSEIYGGGEMADVYGNTLVHFKKGKAGHNAYGGGLGLLTDSTDAHGNILPDNRQKVLASADIKRVDGVTTKITGESFVVFDGKEEAGVATYTHYEFEKAKTFEIVDGVPVEHVTDQFNPADPEKLFSIDHNIYGGGMTASKVEGKTFVHINYGMVNDEMMNFEHEGQKVWSMIYNSIANAQFCVFGGGYGYHTDIEGDANVTMDVQGDGTYKYINQFTEWFAGPGKEKYHWDTNTGSPEAIYAAADEATWSHGAPGRSCMDIIGGGYNGKVLGSTNVIVGGDVVLRKVYGGGYYSSVGHTNVTIKSGIFNRVYGGGLIGNVYGKANLTLGQQGVSQAIHDQNLHLLVKDAVYGGNDVSGTVGTSDPIDHETADHVHYNVYNPVDDEDHGVRLNMYGGLVLGDVYGAGNGNHPGYGNPNYMQFGHSQHPSENYRKVIVEGETEITNDNYALVYKYRPRTGRVVMNLQGNAGMDFNDEPLVDKVRIWGRTFGGGNSCNVGIWDGTQDDNAEVYSDDDNTSWHPGDNFQGGGTISINVGDHVQLGNRNDSHTTPNGLFMGSNGEHMITQHLDVEKARYYHQYYDMKAKKYYPGFVVYEDDAVTPIRRSAGLKAFTAFINNILTKTDSVKLKVADDVADVWMSNFVGGGYRGSMQAKTATGQFRYELPQGVTIGHSAVGGAFNAHIIYRVYATDYQTGTYTTDSKGNYQYELVTPPGKTVISKAEADSIDIANHLTPGTTPYDYIRKLYDEDGHLTGYLRYNFDGGILAHDSEQNAASTGSRIHQIHDPANLTTADFTSDGGYIDNQTKALLYLKLQNQLHPMVHEATDSTVLNVHGGIVYGGCFLTGFVDGDTWLEYDCSLSPLCKDRRFFAQDNDSIYGEVADMVRNNALNIFGAGYGEDTHTMGDVYLHINSQGNNSRYPFIYNAFGGSNLGTVAGSTNVYYNSGQQGTMLGSLYGGGYKGDIGGNTYVELVQGFMVNAYGGSRQANIGGASHVWAYDGSTRAKTGIKSDFCPLIICNLYGGNDISGTISGTMPATWTKNVWTELEGKSFNSYIQVSGTNPGEKGFPLVGSVYGGGNGEQWADSLGAAPDVAKTLLEIDGGTTLRAFGGGNKATVTDSVYIFTNASTDKFADVTLGAEYQKHVLEHKFFSGTLSGYTWDGLHLKMDSCHAFRLFGGNNVAEMNIQPQWNLKDGKLGSVYAGGNLGNMTCPDGLSIHVESDTVEIDNLFGGCRMADVQAIRYNKDGEGHVTSKDTLTFAENQYGATANVSAGRVHNVYGGNDVAGHVYNGTNVNITGGIIDNVYGAGNGDYIYQYNTGNDAPAEAGTLEERMHADNGGNDKYIYYTFRGTKKGASAMEKLQAINTIRPNVDKAYLYIQGTESNSVMLTGNVYCGGNATTVCGDSAYTKLDIGSYCTLDGVYMGSNGEHMADTTALDHLCQVNSMNLNTMGLLREYMSAVAMPALPRGFALSDTITHTYIGTFCLGGNRGSMTSDQPVHIALPQSLTIYNKVVGGCNQAYLGYGGYTTTGGFTTYNHDTLRTLPKIRLDIRSQFVPMKLNKETLTWDETIEDGMLNDKYCNVYGGCYTRGYIYGDVEINMYSDMVGTFDQDVLENNIAYNETNGRPVFSIFGGGYGANTVIYGNTHIRLLNNHNIIGTPALARDAEPALVHPSVNAIYGGGEQGKMIGTSTIHIADGTVYSNVVGGALNGSIYGNTEILVGYPSYYEVQKTGEYLLKRSNFTAEELAFEDGAGNKAVKQSIFLTKGDRINAAVHQAIVDWDAENGTHQADALELTQNKVQKNWDDIDITIKGGIYGGGYARENVEDGQTAMANTVLKFTSAYNLATAHPELWTAENTLLNTDIDMQGEYEYGGNATIWVQDEVNAQNWGNIVGEKKEHITITTETDSDAHTGKGGIFGDGHSSLVAAFRSAAVEGYGYAEHPANDPKLLNTFQRFDILQIRDCAMKMYGQIDVATGQNDPTLYSVSRISELMLNSHIDADAQDLLATSNLNARNVIDFYNPVHYLGSITSDVNFKQGSTGSKYHDTHGALADSSYYDYKTYQVSQNYDYQANGIHADSGCKEQFARRNAGTAKNMIRIDDPEGRGVHLKVVQENNYAVNSQGVKEEQSFYGPLSGVFEFELTHANARGGGYVYSNNLHQQTIAQSQAKYPGTETDTESFLQTSGNVFFVPVHLQGSAKDRFVYDDCYPIPYSDRGDGQLEKAHYWFVEGDGPTWCSYPNKPEIIDEANSIIHIRTAEELAWVYDYIDHGYDSNKTEGKGDNDKYPAGFAGWKIVLDNDLDLEQLTILDQREVRMIWCPIADQKDTYFKGTFDGNGHKIDGMLLDVDFITTLSTYGLNQNYADGYDHYFGLFAKTQNAVVKNVELTAALVRNSGGNENEMVHIGTLITQVEGSTVINCSVELIDTILTDKTNEIEAAAAFICHTTGDSSYIARNFVSGTMEANAPHVTAPISGFISRLDNGSKMEHCYSLVNVHARQVAGLADTVQGGAFLEHSYYAGKLTRENSETQWGAIVANASNANIKHCYYDATKNPVAKGYRGSDAVFRQVDGYTNWSTYGLSTQEMTADQDGTPYKVWRSCYSHDHTSEGETHPCEIDGDSQEFQPHTTAWNKGVWTYLPGLYPILKAQELDCSALTTAFVMPAASSFDMTTRTDLMDEYEQERWLFVDKHFQLPAYGTMSWSVANNTLLLDSVSNKAQNKVNAHLYLGGPDVLSINCDDYHRQMQDIYVTREDINNPTDIAWYDTLKAGAKTMLANQLYVANFTKGMLRNKEVTNISKKQDGVYPLNGFDGDLHIWNREGNAGTVTNPRQYKVNGTITYYTGYTNPYLWHEVNIPYMVDSVSVYRTKSGNEYRIDARTSNIAEKADGGNFWLRSFASDAEIQYGGSVFQQGWMDPSEGENYGKRPSVLRFPKTMKVDGTEYLAGDYWCYNQENNIDGEDYHNGGSEIRFYSTPGNTVYGTQDWDGNEDHRGADNIYSFRVYGNPTLGNIQLEGYYWMLEGEKRDTTGVNDNLVKPEFGTHVAQWFSLQQDPVIKPLGIWIDGPENFKEQALDEGSSYQLRLSPLHEPGVNDMFGEKEASFIAHGFRGLLGVFSYIDQVINVYDTSGQLMFTTPVQANTGFTLNLPSNLFLVAGSNSPKPVKVLL